MDHQALNLPFTPYYRADKRQFCVGGQVTPAGDYYGMFTAFSKVAEDSLERHRPDSKLKRTSCLFLFEDLLCARKHWSSMTNGKLYLVTIDNNSILHRGDMAIMDSIKKLAEEGKGVAHLADAYWRGEISQSPVIEIMVKSAVVAKVLSDSEIERKNYFRDRKNGICQ